MNLNSMPSFMFHVPYSTVTIVACAILLLKIDYSVTENGARVILNRYCMGNL